MREDTCPQRPGSGSRQPRREAPENKPAGLRHQHCPLCSPQGTKPCPGGSSPRAAQPYRSFQELPQSEERRGEETRARRQVGSASATALPSQAAGPTGPTGQTLPPAPRTRGRDPGVSPSEGSALRLQARGSSRGQRPKDENSPSHVNRNFPL